MTADEKAQHEKTLAELRQRRCDYLRRAIEYGEDAQALCFSELDTKLQNLVLQETQIIIGLRRDCLCEILRCDGQILEMEGKK